MDGPIFDLCRKCAPKSVPEEARVLYELGYKLLYGGNPYTHKKAVSYIKLAADMGDAEAQYQYSQLLMFGGSPDDGVLRDEPNGRRYLKMAVDQCHINAMRHYAFYLSEGAHGFCENKQLAECFSKKVEKMTIQHREEVWSEL
jgi:TPR repeat protein